MASRSIALRGRHRLGALAAASASLALAVPRAAFAQQPATLPELPPPDDQSAPPPPPPAPPPSAASVYYDDQMPPPPPPPRHEGHDRRAPRFALWTGARFGLLGFGGGFYGTPVGNPPVSTTEWTSNLVTPGPTLEADLGVRLAYRFVPYVFYERAILGTGSRFAGEGGTSAYSELYGAGLRFTAGDVDRAAFLTEISLGERTVGVQAGGQTYKMSGFEYFKLGLGAEIRLTSRLLLSPLASLSTGSMQSTSGSVTFSPSGSSDGNTHPPFENGTGISDQRGYVMLSLTCGAHFDLLGGD